MQGDEIIKELASDAPRLPSEVIGFANEMNALGVDWEPVPVVVCDAEPGGSIDQDFFYSTLKLMEGYLRAAGQIDGVYVVSHGAMRATEEYDPDARVYEMVRDVVGHDIPLLATLDLHANVSEPMATLTDVLVAYLTNPHVDQRERAAEAARIMKAQQLAAIEFEIDVIVLHRRRKTVQHPESAGHTQVQQQAIAIVEQQQQVLGAALYLIDSPAHQALFEIVRDRPAQAAIPHPHGCQPTADDVGFDAAADGFDFGEFGHGAHGLRPESARPAVGRKLGA